MTRKDYVRLANALRNAQPSEYRTKVSHPASIAWRACVAGIACTLAAENVRFDHTRFEDACGVFECAE